MLERIVNNSPLSEVKQMAAYYAAKGIDYDQLAQELREEFSIDQYILMRQGSSERQLLLNSLESRDNPYRFIFEAKSC
jgi:type III restriction enzyme